MFMGEVGGVDTQLLFGHEENDESLKKGRLQDHSQNGGKCVPALQSKHECQSTHDSEISKCLVCLPGKR